MQAKHQPHGDRGGLCTVQKTRPRFGVITCESKGRFSRATPFNPERWSDDRPETWRSSCWTSTEPVELPGPGTQVHEPALKPQRKFLRSSLAMKMSATLLKSA